mmetsp:Transcript_24689/g.46109  ORF Transcript_24689/g.46109 Transcript_24689/m.46109 type:complete len:98 (+) Transcript_24689:314-607(+)
MTVPYHFDDIIIAHTLPTVHCIHKKNETSAAVSILGTVPRDKSPAGQEMGTPVVHLTKRKGSLQIEHTDYGPVRQQMQVAPSGKELHKETCHRKPKV